MRARLLAIFVLILLIGIPAGMYYYFTAKQVASITIATGTGNIFQVHLSGSFGVDGLPLADRFLSYDSNCVSSCQISPVLPATYVMTLTATGKMDITDTITINTADTLTRTYAFNDDILFQPIRRTLGYDTDLVGGLIANAKTSNIGEFTPIGNDISGRVWAIREGDTFSQIGILSTDRFTPVESITTPITTAMMDTSQSVVVASLISGKTLLLPIDLSGSREIMTSSGMTIISVTPGQRWYIRTGSTSYELSGDQLLEDIRFTDSIDLSPTLRLGYIDKDDTTKLSLGNFPLGQSVLIRLDRTTGETAIVRKGLDILTFFFYDGQPAYMGTSHEAFTIEL